MRRADLLLFCLMASGCGGSGLTMTPVSGKATYNGGQWPLTGRVTFTPQQGSTSSPKRPGSGEFRPDGEFTVGSYQPGDGLLPGTYDVGVSCMKPLDTKTRPEDLDYVPAGFKPNADRIKDGVLVIEEGSSAIELSFDVPKKD